MNRVTVEALNRLNRSFYERRAHEFSATRRRAWPGWKRALATQRGLSGGGPTAAGPWILDLGCGNGRFAAFAYDRLGAGHRYLGLDASRRLLIEARGRADVVPGARFVAADLVGEGWPLGAGSWRPDWIVAFGLFHHIPGRENRARLLAEAASQLAPGGLLTISFWQFGTRKRFAGRRAAWAGIERSELEEGDHFLRWGDGEEVRYCHHVDDAEALSLTRTSGLEPVCFYRSDGDRGDLNLYALLRKE